MERNLIKIKETKLYKKASKNLIIFWNKVPAKKSVTNGEALQYQFCLNLVQYAVGKYYDWKRIPEAHKQEAMDIYRKINRTSSKAFQFQRLLFGYRIGLSPSTTGLSSENGNIRENKTAHDHIIGSSIIGYYVVKTFNNRLRIELGPPNRKDKTTQRMFKTLAEEKHDQNWFEIIFRCAEDLSKNWLKDNLCLWSQCRLSHDEHKFTNLPRGWLMDKKEIKKSTSDLNEEQKLEIIRKKLNFTHYNNANIKVVDYVRDRI
jgi:hypothetical protein